MWLITLERSRLCRYGGAQSERKGKSIFEIRFGGYLKMVRAVADAIYGGVDIEATQNDYGETAAKQGYQRQLSHDGVYEMSISSFATIRVGHN